MSATSYNHEADEITEIFNYNLQQQQNEELEAVQEKRQKYKKWEDGRKNKFRIKTKYILLTYAQTPEDFDWKALVKLVEEDHGSVLICRELHQDGNPHHHAMVKYPDTWSGTRDERMWDISDVHPNIRPINRTPHKTYDYVMKDVDGSGEMLYSSLLRPAEKRGGPTKRKADEVWKDIYAAPTKKAYMEKYLDAYPRQFSTSFSNISNCGNYLYGGEDDDPEYRHPESIAFDTSAHPEIGEWQRRWASSFSSADALTACYGRAESGGLVGRYGEENAEASSLEALSESDCPSLTTGTSVTDFGENTPFEFEERYEIPKLRETNANSPQPRPRSLIIFGPTKTGKTLLARSMGKHVYFHTDFNLNVLKSDVEYAVFDDIRKGLPGIDFKAWLGGQHEFTTSDKYRAKKKVIWGKPSIFLSNKNPLEAKGLDDNDRDWIRGNCDIVEISAPIYYQIGK